MTISHLLDPIISALAKYGTAPGQLIPTYSHPNGTWIQARVAPLIADLEGSCKASGFLSHAATIFCSFCLCKQEDLKMLTLAPPCNSIQVHSQADAWLNTETKSSRAALEKETGVQGLSCALGIPLLFQWKSTGFYHFPVDFCSSAFSVEFQWTPVEFQ